MLGYPHVASEQDGVLYNVKIICIFEKYVNKPII